MPIPHRYGVQFMIIATTTRGWELAIAFRKADGAFWAVVNDGLTLHEGDPLETPHEAEADVLGLAGELEVAGQETKQHAAASAGVN